MQLLDARHTSAQRRAYPALRYSDGMSIDGSTDTPQGDPPPRTAWGFSGHVAALVQTREQALATIRFFAFLRKTIVAAPLRGMTSAEAEPRVTPQDAERWRAGGFSDDQQVDALLRALHVIALDPADRADTLLSLDAQSAYLRGRFAVPEPV